ncbi:MAG TPA: cystathionine beta-lyase [Gemmatimonadaceae bacterium]|nr:cystathionine beta-lyase [Gemmatimonadaceae bacterium]
MNSGRFRTPNPPVHRASTILFDNVEHLMRTTGETLRGEGSSIYPTFGTPTSQALASLVAEREQGSGAVFAPSGLAAVALGLLSILRTGDHLLMVDTVYGPTRGLCDGVLRQFGVEPEYYDPTVGGDIAAMIRPNTRAIFMESPGSFTFDVQDVPAIVAAARDVESRREAPLYTIIDNAWGSPGLFVPLAHGVDVSIIPLTKYWGGHADFVLGAVVGNERAWKALRGTAWDLGLCAAPDDAALALRGARTADVRLRQHAESALTVAQWLTSHPRVGAVLHPALPGSPGHELWRRDFTGSNGLLSFELLDGDGGPAGATAAAQVADALTQTGAFGLGYSWGGFESLVMPGVLPDGSSHMARAVRPWSGGTLVRLHIGLEPVDQLIGALRGALSR